MKTRGLTLVEVLIAAGISSVLMVVVGALLLMVKRSYEEQRERASLQTELLNARESLLLHLSGTATPILVQPSEVVTATFQRSGKPHYSSGMPQWQSYLGFRQEGRLLVRRRLDFSPNVVCPPIPIGLASNPAAQKFTVAHHVSLLKFTLDSDMLITELSVQDRGTTLQGRFSVLLQDALL